MLLPSCGEEAAETLPDETFQRIYGEILYKAELYRSDTLRMQREFDSLLTAYGTDTTQLFATARAISTDRDRVDELYRVTIERFERMARGPDSTAADSSSAAPERIADEDY